MFEKLKVKNGLDTTTVGNFKNSESEIAGYQISDQQACMSWEPEYDRRARGRSSKAGGGHS